jgi:hypothetical protein
MSRYLLRCQALERPIKRVFETSFCEFGLPLAISPV